MTTESKSDNSDIVIIGAGLAGLSTARKIHQLCISQSKPLPSITIIEADGRVGGRTNTIKYKGLTLDIGAHWIGSTHTNLLNLVRELDLHSKVYKQSHAGSKILDVSNRQSLYHSDIPFGVGLISLIDVQLLLWDMERIARSLYSNQQTNNKTQLSYMQYLDSITMESLLSDLSLWTVSARQLSLLMIRLTVGCEPSQCSALQFINMVKQAGCSIDRLGNIENGYQESPIHGGTQQISQLLLKQLMQQNNKLKLVMNHAVFKVDQNMNHECVVYFAPRVDQTATDQNTARPTITSDDISLQSKLEMDAVQQLTAKYVVSAVPLYINGRYIEFNPALPSRLHNVFSKCYQGGYRKGYAFFDECFWRKFGFSGEIAADSRNGPIMWGVHEDTEYVNENQAVLDKYWKGKKVYCLVALSGGDPIYKWSEQSKQQRQEAHLKQLSMYFNKLIPAKQRNGEDLVKKHCVGYLDCSWVDCGPFDVYPPGVGWNEFDTDSGDGQKAFIHGNVHFVSTNLGSKAAGYMEGAVASGMEQGRIVFDRMYNGLILQQDDEDEKVEKETGAGVYRYTSLKKMIKTGFWVTALVACSGYLVHRYVDKNKLRDTLRGRL